jgi:hypothetical protein
LGVGGNTTIAGTLGVTGNGTIGGDLVVNGKLTAQEVYTEITSASIIFESGSTKFGDDYKIMQFSDFKNRREEIEVEEKEEELRKIKSSEEDELKKIKLSPKHISSITEPKTKVKSIQPPRTIDGFFRLLPTELENEVKDVYNLLLQARESTKEISDRYRRLGKFASDDMKSEIAGLGIAMLKEKIKGMLSNNISSKFMDSFNDMFDPKPLIREGFVYFNTEFGMLKLTEEQLESISYLL